MKIHKILFFNLGEKITVPQLGDLIIKLDEKELDSALSALLQNIVKNSKPYFLFKYLRKIISKFCY